MAEIRIGGGSRASAVPTAVGLPDPNRAIQAAFGGAADIVEARQANDDNADLIRKVELKGQYERESLAATSQLDPTSPDYERKVEDALGSIEQGIMANTGINSTDINDRLALDLASMNQAGQTAASIGRRSALESRALDDLDEAHNSALANIAADPDGFEAYLDQMGTAAADLSGAVSPAKMLARGEAFADAAMQAQVEGYARAGNSEQAKARLEELAPALSQAKFREITNNVRAIQNQQRNDQLQATSAELADMGIRIIESADMADVGAMRTEVETKNAAGFYEGREDTRRMHVAQIEARRRQIIENGRDLQTALGKSASGTGVDSPKEAAALWEHEMEGNPLTPETTVERVTSFTKQNGVMPPQVKRIIENAERVEDGKTLSIAAELDRSVRNVAPGAKTGAGDRTAMVQAYHDLGMAWDAAAELVLDRVPDQAQLSIRSDEFKEISKDFDPAELGTDMLQDSGIAPTFFFSPDALVPEAAAAQAEKAFRDFYLMSGDEDAAKSAAVKSMEQTGWGPTSTGGRQRVVQHPVERFWPAGEAAMPIESRTQVIDELVGMTLGALGLPEGSEYILESDGTTRQQVELGQRSSRRVMVPDRWGLAMVPVPTVDAAGNRVDLRVFAPTIEQVRGAPSVVARRKAGAVRAGQARANQDFREISSQREGF